MITDALLGLFRPRAESNDDTPGYIQHGLTPYVAGWHGSKTLSGERINTENASNLADVYTCVAIRSMSLASFPIHIYRRLKPKGNIQGSERVFDDDLNYLLNSQPNPLMNKFNFLQTLQKAVDLYGNGYALLVRGPDYAVREMYPIHPSRVSPEIQGNTLRYKVRVANSQSHEYFAPDEVLHIRQDTDDGIVGVSKVQLLCEELGLVKAARAYTATYFANGPTPGGIIKLASAKPNPQEVELMRAEWSKRYTGGNRHKIAIINKDQEFIPLTIQNDHAQLLETSTHLRRVIASIFRVPSWLLNDPDGFAYNSTVEAGKNLEKHTFREIASSYEHEANIKLFWDRPDIDYCQFDLSELSRNDTEARVDTACKAITNRLWTQDEAREYTSRPPATPDQEFWANRNNLGPAPSGEQPPTDNEARASTVDARPILRPFLADAFSRIVARDVRHTEQAITRCKGDAEKFKGWIDKQHKQRELQDFAREALLPIAGTCDSLRIPRIDVDAIAEQYATSSKGQLSAVLRKQGIDGLAECLAGWSASRAAECTEAALAAIPQSTTTVEQPDIDVPLVVRVKQQPISVNVPQCPAPVVNYTPPAINVEAPQVTLLLEDKVVIEEVDEGN